MVTVLPLFDPEQLHHSGKGFSNDPDPVVSEPVELAGLHALLLELPAVLPLVLFRGLKIKRNKLSYIHFFIPFIFSFSLS